MTRYRTETFSIAEKPQSVLSEIEIEMKPKDAQLRIDGEPALPAGKVQLQVGPHVLLAAKDGYAPLEKTIVVFPDLHPKVKLHLKKS